MKHSETVRDLERLASVLITKAETAEAKAQECAKFKEMAEAAKHTARANNARMFAQTCSDAASKLRSREKRKGFIPPTWEEALDYTTRNHPDWPHADVLSWWNHFESVGWKVGSGKGMVNWQRAADNGYRFYMEKKVPTKQEQPSLFRGTVDPEKWTSFLKSAGLPYQEFKYAPEWRKTDFYKFKKGIK